MRKTIHLIATDDAGWMLPLFEPEIERWSRRRLGQLGMPEGAEEKALRTVARALERDGPLTRSELADRVVATGVELNPMTRGHLMGLAVSSGLACLGPDRGRTTCLVLRQDWLGTPPPFDREAALAELARRYLGAFGPATDRDFAYWTGLGLGEVRAGLAAIAGEIEENRLGAETMLSLRGKRPRLPSKGWVRLLGAFDTYLLGYKDRSFAASPRQAAAVKEGGGGWIRPVIVRDGVVIGGWRMAVKRDRIEIAIKAPGAVGADERAAIEAEVADIGRFMDRSVASR